METETTSNGLEATDGLRIASSFTAAMGGNPLVVIMVIMEKRACVKCIEYKALCSTFAMSSNATHGEGFVLYLLLRLPYTYSLQHEDST